MLDNLLYVDFIKNIQVDKSQWRVNPEVCVYIDSPEGLEEIKDDFFRCLDNPGLLEIGFDIETSKKDGHNITSGEKPDFRTDILSVVQVSDSELTYVFKLTHIHNSLFQKFAEKIATKAWIGHNIKFDAKFMKRDFNVMPPLFFDTEIAAKCLEAEPLRSYNFKTVMSEHMGIGISKEAQIANWGAFLITDDMIGYAARDAYYSVMLKRNLTVKLNAMKHNYTLNEDSPYVKTFGVYHKIFQLEMEIVRIFTEMENYGFMLDRDAVLEAHKKIKVLESEKIWALLAVVNNVKLNPRSPAQMLKKIKELYPTQGRLNEKGQFEYLRDLDSLDKDRLKFFVNKGMPLVDRLHDFKEITGQLQRLEEFQTLTRHDPRVYPDFRVWGAITGRTSCKKPNLQNIKNLKNVESATNKVNLKDMFIASPGTNLAVVDFAQIQLVIIACLTKDPVMMDVILNGPETGNDLHRTTSSFVNGVDIKDVTKDMRQAAKAINFGFCTVYGTKVLTTLGDKNIENIEIGDVVLTHKENWKKVTQTFNRVVDTVYEITTDSGKVVSSTGEHPWYSETPVLKESYWCETHCLKVGQVVFAVDSANKLIRETVISKVEKKGSFRVADITVEDDHSFIANGLVSHNCFGMGWRAFIEYALLQYDVIFTDTQAEVARNKFFELYKGLARWHRDVQNSRRGGWFYTRSFYGRDCKAANFTDATNYPIQGAEANILKLSLVLIDQEMKKKGVNAQLINVVHDEVVYEIEEDRSEEGFEIITRNMSKAGGIILKNILPVRVSGALCKKWSEGH